MCLLARKMKITYKLNLYLLLVFTTGMAQTPLTNSFNTATDIFKVFEENMDFLSEKQIETDSLHHYFVSFYKNPTATKMDSIGFINHLNRLQKSVEEFTNFNVPQVVHIARRLQGIHPIRGSELSYLNKSYQTFSKYQLLFQFIDRKSSILKKYYSRNFANTQFLAANLNQIHFFYKNFYTSIENTRIRRILNAEDTSYGKNDKDFKKIVKQLLCKKNYKRIRKKITQIRDIDTSKYRSNSLYNSIKDTPYKNSRMKKDRKKIKRYFNSDNAYRIGQFFTQQISGAIGNFAGMFRFRKGYLYKNDSLIQSIKSELEPMDILSEKTGFALTDKMIPGHFGHIAIWLGTQKQLEEAHLWNQPIIKPFQNRIKSGFCILETDREGTHLKTLKKFMNVDELAIVRINGFSELPTAEKIVIYQNALAQLGKGYDFNFDVETSDKLVCSELLYQVFGAIHWPTDRLLKRSTISPDNVLSLVLYQNSPLQLSFYVGATDRNRIQLRNTDTLASDLGFSKQNNQYVYPEKKCERKYIKAKRRKKKKCKTIYHSLIYE